MGGAQAQLFQVPTVAEIISNDAKLSIFAAAIKQSGHVSIVGSHDPQGTQYTILVPSDEAFKSQIRSETLTGLLSSGEKKINDHLKAIAGCHVLVHDQPITTEMLNGLAQASLTAQAGLDRLGPFQTLNPEARIYFTRAAGLKGPKITLEDSEGTILKQTTFERMDLGGSNGVVHVVKDVLIAKEREAE